MTGFFIGIFVGTIIGFIVYSILVMYGGNRMGSDSETGEGDD